MYQLQEWNISFELCMYSTCYTKFGAIPVPTALNTSLFGTVGGTCHSCHLLLGLSPLVVGQLPNANVLHLPSFHDLLNHLDSTISPFHHVGTSVASHRLSGLLNILLKLIRSGPSLILAFHTEELSHMIVCLSTTLLLLLRCPKGLHWSLLLIIIII